MAESRYYFLCESCKSMSKDYNHPDFIDVDRRSTVGAK